MGISVVLVSVSCHVGHRTPDTGHDKRPGCLCFLALKDPVCGSLMRVLGAWRGGLFLGSLKRKVGNGGDTLFRFYLGNGYRCFSLLFSLHASGERACMHKLWFISGLAVLASCLAIQIVFKHWGDQVRESWH